MTGIRSVRIPLYAAGAFWLACVSQLLAGEIKPAADAPQPLAPEESLKRFQLPPGFRIELVASEPLLADPTGMAFDARGRLFVCELHGYNLEGHYDVMALNQTGVLDTKVQRISASKEALEHAEKETYGTVKMLEDTDGDGRMDRASVWADRLPACYGLVAAREGVIVFCAPDIVYLADRDGDGRAEVRETLFTGFGVGELWTRINNPQWGMDNWIYAACGEGSAGTIRGPRLAAPVPLGKTSFRFKPDGTRFEPVSGGTSGFGLALSDWDDRFLISNQQHALLVAPLPYHYLARNPHFAAPNTVINISTYGRPAKVYPAAPPDPWRLKRSQQPEWVKFYGAEEANMGLVTAICAPLVYRADQFPEEYRDNHFSCESAYNLIHRCVLVPEGAGFKAVRSTENSEFLTSSEQWFRPVNLALGPDGAMYIVDMYREIIEDYTAIPRYLQQQYGLIKGDDRGRIWRVVYDGSQTAFPLTPTPSERERAHGGREGKAGSANAALPNLAAMPARALVNELSSGNAWRRLTAQRLLVERGDASVAAALADGARRGPTPQSRLHALYTLDGLRALEPALAEAALADPHPGVRWHALRLAETWLDQRPSILQKVLAMVDDPDAKVRLQVAFTLGETRNPAREPALVRLATRFGADRWMQTAIVSSAPDSAGRLLRQLMGPEGIPGDGRHLVRPLVGVIGSRQQNDELAELLQTVAAYRASDAVVVQTNCLAGLAEGLRRGKPPALTGSIGPAALRELLASESPAVRRLALEVAGLLKLTQTPELLSVFTQAGETALNPDRPLAARLEAVARLASAPFATLAPLAKRLLAATQPLEIQLAAIQGLSASDDPGVGAALLAGWNGYSPKAQAAVLDALFRRQDRLLALLDAIEQKTIPQPGLDAFRRSQLLTNPHERIRQRAQAVLARDVQNPDRQAVLARYQAALSGLRDARRGQEIFLQQCAPCHRLQNQGKEVGPDLTAATKGRADETILLDIFQPSDQITAGYASYTVVTKDGALFTGVLSSETATSVTLPNEDGLVQTILRKDIESMQSSPVSLMPANFEDLLQPQDVADLLGYLREVTGPAPGPALTLFDDERAFAAALNEGDGTVTVVAGDAHSGLAALRVTPPQRFSARIADWNYRIVENPEPGQYRYLRFAWKAPEAKGVMLELAASGQWPQANQALRRYYAGHNTTGWQARQLASEVPREWTVVLVDLWQDFGEFTLTGLAPTAMGGPAFFDRIELRQTPEVPQAMATGR